MKVGIIGCGTIGSEIAFACQDALSKKIELCGICDVNRGKADALSGKLRGVVKVLNRGAIISSSDLVVEAASAKISADIVRECLKKKKDVLVMSVGGLLGEAGLPSRIERSSSRVYVPSGAICGIDGIKAASTGVVRSVTITTRKPPKSLEGAPYVLKHNIALSKIDRETVIFDGSAGEAVLEFPQNINVAAVLGLASGKGKEVRVRIVTSPGYTKNTHEVEVEGDFGKIATRTENVASGRNPKTSQLAILSAIRALENIVSNLKVGT